MVLELLSDDATEDIVLNPDSALWVKRMGEGFLCVGEMPPAQAASALNTIAAWKGTVMNHERPVLDNRVTIRAFGSAARSAIQVPTITTATIVNNRVLESCSRGRWT